MCISYDVCRPRRIELQQRIVLIPNCSLTPATAALFFGFLFVSSLAFALFFSLHGLWLVLPFWGLEMLVLGIALHLSLRRRHIRQELVLTDAQIWVTTTSTAGEEKQQFSRHWASVRLRSPRTNLHPSRLTIESHGRALEIGQFLTEDERRSLAGRLQGLVGRLNESPPLEWSRT
ncbi:MAG: DUF2244 domain-containing protein [Proteobacteria bacterium]|nr:DUF2244 domain-containing protein [Pseudomonadota bacterium]